MDLDLDGKVVFVAGASRGIGFAIAQAFFREKARVVLTGRNPEVLDSAYQVLLEDGCRDRALSIPGDMTAPGDITRALESTLSHWGTIDAVVANVGSGRYDPGWNLNIADWTQALNENLLGSMVLASEVLPVMTKNRSGSIVFISSIAGCEAIGAPIAYGAAKAAVQSGMKSLAREVGKEGVRVNAVSPGNVLFPSGSWEEKLSARREFFEKYIESEVALQRFARPEEIADAVVFLSSSRASFITGACLVVDGGQTRSI